MKMKWKIVTGVTITLLLVAIGYFASAIYSIRDLVPDSYAQWDAALSIIHHMKTHGGAWPKNWDDLKEACESAPGLRGPGWSNLKQRVEIDFTADPEELAKAELRSDKPPFRVVWLRNGKKHHWVGAEPNRLIFEYLINNTEQIDASDSDFPLNDLISYDDNGKPRPIFQGYSIDKFAEWIVIDGKLCCKLHKIELVEDIVPVRYGLIKYNGDYFEARKSRFPNATDFVEGGCVITEGIPKETRVVYCKKCRIEMQLWEDQR